MKASICLKSVSVKSIEGPRALAASVEKVPVIRRSLAVDCLISAHVSGYPGRETEIVIGWSVVLRESSY